MAEQYKKHTHRDHILELPDTYIGSTDTHTEARWVFDAAARKMVMQDLAFNPGFYKIFDEILVNARDALVRAVGTDAPVKHIDVVVEVAGGTPMIRVTNDGAGIPVEEHPEYKVWTPELIFGHLLTSSNYNKSEEKIVGGKNGYGAKLTNIFSTRFVVETTDAKRGLHYRQEWSDHMSRAEKPAIKKSKGKGSVSIEYTPDVTRFAGLDLETMTRVLHTRTIELAALAGREVAVTWNGAKVEANTFEKFVRLFLQDDSTVVYEKCGERWEVAVALARTLYDDDGMASAEKHISFVNGINTRKGGKHVETVMKHVLGDFVEAAKKKKVDIKPALLKQHVAFFVNATVVNPSFDSQTKETLTTPASKFGSQFKTAGKLVDGLMKLGLLTEAQQILDAKAAKEAKKTDGAKKRRLYGMDKLTDAMWAGTAKSSECTLILTEGDSAAASAIAGLKVVGRERWGVFPLRGKLLNVRDISQDKFGKNEELAAIKKILGLEQNKTYTTLTSLRYGRVMVMADQDLDGSHIKGLLMNLFHAEWPSLVKAGFICSIRTPLLKATRGSTVLSFYSMAEFEAWRETLPDKATRGWHIKYYKGLGTSNAEEAEEWFEDIHEIKYVWDDATDNSMSLAFSKKRADDRKKWLAEYDPRKNIDVSKGDVTYSRFIDDELIHFSNGDNIRSLPHIMDGLKPSLRKILFGCFKRNLKSEIKVSQLSGYVSENCAYHHGEASLNGAIVSMAQTFVGANNINLLAPNGQFGTRLMGGKDAASPRYIHTQLEGIMDTLFRKEDACVLKHNEDDGLIVEPETYYPVVPLLIINGSIGIGTGFSTNIPPHNPSEVVTLLRDRIEGRRPTLENLALRPWWLGFRGPVQQAGDGVWVTKGAYTFHDDKCRVQITELPVGTWTHDYKAFLDTMVMETDAHAKVDDKPVLKDFDDLYNHVDVNFVLYLDPDYYEDAKANPVEFEKRFHLTSTWRNSNMVCFNNDTNITNYKCVGDMMEEYYQVRLQKYTERKAHEIARLEREAQLADAKARFLQGVLDGTIDLRRATDEQIVALMKANSLPPLSDEEHPDAVDAYEYLLRIRIDRVKASAIEEAKKAVMDAKAALAKLRVTPPAHLWLRDIDAFMAAWDDMRATREKKLERGVTVKTTKKTTGGPRIKVKKA
jgi:DNA topoisomerase II